MNNKNLLFLGAGFMAGRMLKRKPGGLIGAAEKKGPSIAFRVVKKEIPKKDLKYVGYLGWEPVYEFKGRYWTRSHGNFYTLLDKDYWPYIRRH